MSKTNPHQDVSPPEVRVVEASAGSGKTFQLAKRYLQLLLDPGRRFSADPFHSILAITFTKKAALEMKSRILEFLKSIALNEKKAVVTELAEGLKLSPEEMSESAYPLMDNLIRHYNFFQVQTIDKFVNTLLSGCAFKIGLSAKFRIKTDAREYLERSLDALIDQAADSGALRKRFEVFLHNFLYLEGRMGWFPKEDMLGILGQLFRLHNTYGQPFKMSGVGADELIKHKRVFVKDLRHLREILPEGTHKTFLKRLDGFLAKYDGPFDIEQLSGFFMREEVPLNKSATATTELLSLWRKVVRDLDSICREEAYSVFNPYIDIFEDYQREVLRVAIKDDVVFLSELNRKAGALFGEDAVTVQELYYRLASRFRHYLIDEFQDTSFLQWRNLQMMIEEALATGGTLFYVGDRKQAIYGFRGGDVKLFTHVKDSCARYRPQEETLLTNYRSQRKVVEFNNEIFSLTNLERFAGECFSSGGKSPKDNIGFDEPDQKRLRETFANAQQKFLPEHRAGYVRSEFVPHSSQDERNEIMKEKLLALIDGLKERFALRDIAVLTRKNSEVEEVTGWLLGSGIPAESERTLNIKNHALISDLIALLKFLNSPIDNLSFSSFLLGGLFSGASGIDRESLHRFVFDCRDNLRREKNDYLYLHFRRDYTGVWDEFLSEFFKNVGLYPLYELMVSIYARFKVLEHFPQDQGFFMQFLEFVKKNENEYMDLSGFLEFFDRAESEDLFVPAGDAQAVKVLTIHKSKGLEFEAVVLPFMQFKPEAQLQDQDTHQSFAIEEQGDSLELLRLKDEYCKFSSAIQEVYSRKYKESFFSELNNAYVAFTRARSELYIFVPEKAANSKNLMSLLIPQKEIVRGKPGTYPVKGSHKNYFRLPCLKAHDWIDYLKDEFMFEQEIVNRDSILKGRVLHALLSAVSDLSDPLNKKGLAASWENLQAEFPQVADWPVHCATAKKMVDDDALRNFFYTDGDPVLTEQEIVAFKGGTRRIDRLIIKKDEVWIVDYKSSLDSRADALVQLAEYEQVVKGLYPNRAVRKFLIFFDTLKSEELR